jgi:transposase
MQINAEPVGDLAVISRLIQATNLASRVDEHFPRHHLWQGPGLGKTLQALLMYILSENDHRLYNVEGWASNIERSLSWLLEEPGFTAGHLSDDRLGNLLDCFSKSEERWELFQRSHNRALIRFYKLEETGESHAHINTIRIDSTTGQSYRPESSLFQMGHNASGLALPQIKMMLLAMDKGNLPIAMNTVSGEQSDDRLYIRVLELAWRQGLTPEGILVVGDRKLCNRENTCFIANSGNYYLGPLAQRQFSVEELSQALQWVKQQPELPEKVMRWAAGAKQAQPIAKVKELPGRLVVDTEGQEHWQRLMAVCSLSLRKRKLEQLQQRLDKAQEDIRQRFTRKRGRKTLSQVSDARQAAEKILDKHKVGHLFSLHIEPPTDKNSPCLISLELNPEAHKNEQFLAGWRVMATNAPADRLSAQEAVLCYWEEYRIEQQFHLLLNKCTALRPIFLKKENRIVAMLKIMMLALQYSNLWQYTLRGELKQQQEPYLTKVVPGNPGMKVHQPTTKLVLKAFKKVQAIYVHLPEGQRYVQIQGLEPHHQRLLRLLKLPDDVYLHPLCQ